MAKIMVQGTTSSAGKSLLCTGLMRLFHRRGLDAFPFKAQNMSSKCYVTKDGKKIATAQALQAWAGGLEPSVEMNPILLMPKSDSGSMVVLLGEEYRAMEAREYFAYKKELRPWVGEIAQRLEKDHDVLVIEGAGSPAEINLRENDLVNMGLAELIDAPVLLIADIDRGGVFASIYGTVMLLRESERARIKGLIINKFRGDASLLESGIKTIEELTGIPVVGLIPYCPLELVDEDSLVDVDKRVNHEEQSMEERERELDTLADLLESALDMEKIYEIAGLDIC